MSIHQASHLQTFCTQRFFINSTVETTERSRCLDSVLFYSVAALTLANYSQSPVTKNPRILVHVKPHLRRRSANTYRTSETHVFLSLRAGLNIIDNLNKKNKIISVTSALPSVATEQATTSSHVSVS